MNDLTFLYLYFNKGENLINKLFKKFKAEAGVGTAAAKLGRTGATKRGAGSATLGTMRRNLQRFGSGFRGLLDPDGDFWLDPDPGSMNTDPKHCWLYMI